VLKVQGREPLIAGVRTTKENRLRWLQYLLRSGPKAKQPAPTPPRWTSHRGDEWWCDDASAGYACGNFTIGSFGKYASPSFALLLIKDAREGFPDATLDIHLDVETRPIVDALVARRLIEITEIELSPKTRIARIDKVL
jgi:hypothetical protein